MGLKKWLLRLTDVLSITILIFTIINLFWVPVLGTSTGKFTWIVFMLLHCLYHIISRIRNLEVVVHGYSVNGRSLKRITISSKGSEKDDE